MISFNYLEQLCVIKLCPQKGGASYSLVEFKLHSSLQRTDIASHACKCIHASFHEMQSEHFKAHLTQVLPFPFTIRQAKKV